MNHNLENNCEDDEESVRVTYLLPAQTIDQANFVVNCRLLAGSRAVSALAVCYTGVATQSFVLDL
jgi:hypothetical protein